MQHYRLLTGIHKTTILKLLVRFGQACREFLDHAALIRRQRDKARNETG